MQCDSNNEHKILTCNISSTSVHHTSGATYLVLRRYLRSLHTEETPFVTREWNLYVYFSVLCTKCTSSPFEGYKTFLYSDFKNIIIYKINFLLFLNLQFLNKSRFKTILLLHSSSIFLFSQILLMSCRKWNPWA